MLADASQNISSGQLTHGVELDSSITSVIEFIEVHFPQFREKVDGEVTASEKSLTDRLCKYFNRNAGNFPFYFHHENVEDYTTGKSPQVDIGTVSRSEQITIGDRSYNEWDSFFSMEAKRLPTPGQNREKEYVIGHDRPSGGMERFKKRIHGKDLKYAAIIGYIQEKDGNHWYLKINEWIDELILSTPDFWNMDDKLIEKENPSGNLRKFISKNFRTELNDENDFISLFHFWIELI
ncbi:hypothetical protein [Maribacter sp. 2210JD10-5]|uniref:hypothetical protein n=1 Tax=Maribacter sp. 2210JD10-5 TaxID=3386272 RepID=UPI0039BC8558